MEYRIVFRVLGVLICLLSLMMSFCLPTSYYFGDGDLNAILLSAGITFLSGAVLFGLNYKVKGQIKKREGYLIVTMGWFVMALFSTLPYLLSHSLCGFSDAFFESMSGLTTTGASVIEKIEIQPRGILLWRSITQWIGGMGIIVLTVAIFPLLGIGGVELFVAESPGPTSDKIHPRISEVAKRLWLIYVGMTAALAVILKLMGLSPYDAINHAMTTISTGGFSTKDDSVMGFGPNVQYVIALFMIIGGINFTVLYLLKRGKFKKLWQSDELRMYFIVLTFLILLVTALLWGQHDLDFETSFRAAFFQVISMVSTTGFVNVDYTSWCSGITMLFFMMLFIGGSAGSTSGGIKIIRHLVFVKNSLLEFKRILHPRAMIRIKIDKSIVAPRILTHILVFLLIYILIFSVGSLLMTIILHQDDHSILTAVGAVASCLGNVGPGIGGVGPIDNFAQIPWQGKYLLSFIMLLGRLELFSVLILFTPFFWKSN